MIEGAFSDVLAKRKAQLEKGFDAAHDDRHGPALRQFSLAGLAGRAALEAVELGKDGMNAEQAATYRKKILSAASYLLADLDRHDRAEARGDFPAPLTEETRNGC